MFDSQFSDAELLSEVMGDLHSKTPSFWFIFAKRALDVLLSLCLASAFFLVWAVLGVVNRWYNRGPIFFIQKRMGKNGHSFNLYKFRTMAPSKVTRKASDPLETHRISRLGAFLRRARLDELPQVFNVLIGDMILIGPRPDMFEHAMTFLDAIPEYSKRLSVRPGITGLAQTELGYVEGIAATRKKVAVDLQYINRRCARLDMWIFFRTLKIVLLSKGR